MDTSEHEAAITVQLEELLRPLQKRNRVSLLGAPVVAAGYWAITLIVLLSTGDPTLGAIALHLLYGVLLGIMTIGLLSLVYVVPCEWRVVKCYKNLFPAGTPVRETTDRLLLMWGEDVSSFLRSCAAKPIAKKLRLKEDAQSVERDAVLLG